MSEETVPTPDKMKVTELRKALSDRGLNPKGTKAVLVKQLFAAMKTEEDSTEDEEVKNKEEEKEKVNEKDEEEEDKVAEEKKKEENKKKAEEKIAEQEKKKEEEKLAEEKKKEEEKLAEEKKKDEVKLAEEIKIKEAERLAEENTAEEKKIEEEEIAVYKEIKVAVEIEAEKPKSDADMETNEIEPEKSKDSTQSKTKEEIKVDNKCGVKYTKVVRTVYVRQKDNDKKEDVSAEAKRGGTKRKMDEDENQEPNMKKRKVEKDDEKKEETDTKEELFEVVEVEPEIDENLMCLDWYNSDLNLKIGEDKISGQPEHKKGFGYAYAGARATHGFNSRKVWYEVKFEEALDCSLEKEGNRPQLFRGQVG